MPGPQILTDHVFHLLRHDQLGLEAEQGDVDAQCALGVMLLSDHFGPADVAEARRLFGLGVAQGNAKAQCLLGELHRDGRDGQVDFAEARRLHELAAAQGTAEAQHVLGYMHHEGQGGPVDLAEARRLYGLAAAKGKAEAQHVLGYMHFEGQGGPMDLAEARRLYGLAAAQGHPESQFNLGLVHVGGKGGPVDNAEARRLFGLAAAQGHAMSQYNSGVMHHEGQGGPVDAAEARRLYGLAAAQGHAEAQEALNRIEKALRAEQHAAAEAMAQQLLAEDAQEKQAKGAPKATKSAKGKKVTMSRAAAAAPSAATSAAPAKPPSSGGASATKPASDAALRDAMAAGDLDGLSAALEEHRAFASEDVLRETRALRDRLKERRKQKSQRLRRSHPGAMEALARLQGCASEADALREGIAAAEALAGELPALDAELTAARARLEELSIGHSAASAAAPASELASAEAGQAVELTVEDLAATTGGFADQNQIGSGGFGRVYLAAADKLPLASLPAHMRHLSLAVKRAKSYHSGGLLGKLKGEVKMLKDLDHPHLLPLLGYCLSEAAPCLISPLMCGGSLKIRLRPADADPEQLRLLGLTPSLLPLNWTQRVHAQRI